MEGNPRIDRLLAGACPIQKGWSSDQKYRVTGPEGTDCLLRISDPSRFEEKRKEFAIIRKYAALGLPMSQPLDFGRCRAGVYMLLSWLEGEDLEEILPALSPERQYRLGREAGAILRKLHSLPLSPEDRPQTTKREKKLRQLALYEQSQHRFPGDETAIAFVRENIGRIWLEPPVYQHGDFHPGNLIYQPDGAIGVIDFNRWEIGDPFEEFYKLQSFGREVSVPYAVGQIDAYFTDGVPEAFWTALAVYVAHAALYSIKWSERFGPDDVAGMMERCRMAFDDYDGFRSAVPRWYRDILGADWRSK